MRNLLIFVLAITSLQAATKLRMHSAASGVSTYKEANPNLGTGLTTSVTNSAASGTQIQWTATGGGTALNWISPPLAAGVTITGTVTFNTWASESAAQCNCGERVVVKRYTGGAEGSTVTDSARGTELTTSITNQTWTATPSNTSFSAGDRIVVYWYLTNVGTMASGRSSTADYNGSVNASDGETFVQFTETINFAYSGSAVNNTLSAEAVARHLGALRTATDLSVSEANTRTFSAFRNSADLTIAVVTSTALPSQHVFTRNAVDTAFVSESAGKLAAHVRAAADTTLSAESAARSGQGFSVSIVDVIGTGTNWPSLSDGAWAALSDSDWATLSSGLDSSTGRLLTSSRNSNNVTLANESVGAVNPHTGSVALATTALPAGSEESVHIIVKTEFLPAFSTNTRPLTKPYPVSK